MGITAGFCNLKALFIPSDVAFNSVRFDSVKIRWDFMVEDSEANSRKWNNGLIKLSWAAKVWTYPFVLNVSMKLQRIIAHILLDVYGFKSFTKLPRPGYVFLKWRVLRASKEIWMRNFDPCRPRVEFFLAKFLKYKASRCWVAIFLLSCVVLTRNWDDRKSHFNK